MRVGVGWVGWWGGDPHLKLPEGEGAGAAAQQQLHAGPSSAFSCVNRVQGGSCMRRPHPAQTASAMHVMCAVAFLEALAACKHTELAGLASEPAILCQPEHPDGAPHQRVLRLEQPAAAARERRAGLSHCQR